MGCSSCGGGRRKDITVTKAVETKKVDPMTIYTVRYTGTSVGVRRVRSLVPGTAPYRYSANEPVFQVHGADLQRFINEPDFALVNERPAEPQTTESLLVNVTPDFVAERQAVVEETPRMIPIEESPVDDHTRAILQKNGFDTVQQVMMSSDAEILKIPGIGAKRLETLREALSIYK